MKIGIVNYNVGNLFNLKQAVNYLGHDWGMIDKSDMVAQYDKIILPDRCPRTAELLSKHYSVEIVKVSEVSKLDAGLSCMSLRW